MPLVDALLVGSDWHQASKLALSATVWLERELVIPGDLAQVLLKFVEEFRVALCLLHWSKGVQAVELRPWDWLWEKKVQGTISSCLKRNQTGSYLYQKSILLCILYCSIMNNNLLQEWIIMATGHASRPHRQVLNSLFIIAWYHKATSQCISIQFQFIHVSNKTVTNQL